MPRPRGASARQDEADVVVLGFGLAGATAALAAADADPSLDVLVLEKMPPALAGGNSRVSGQSLALPNDRDAFRSYQRALGEANPIPEDVLSVWATELTRLKPRLERMAAEVGMELVVWTDRGPEFPELPGADCIAGLHTIEPNPSGVWEMVRRHVATRPAIRIRYETRALQLTREPGSTAVLGVVADFGGERLAVRARRAIVVCTGGFENDLELQRNYGFETVYTLGSPANTGDGIRMLQAAGAKLWHLRNPTHSAGLWPAIKVPDFPTVFFASVSIESGSWLEVAKDDRRFYDESGPHRLTHYKHLVHGHWLDTPHAFVLPVHRIFDETTRKADCMVHDFKASWNVVVEGYAWSADNAREVERGWITTAASIEQLARRTGRDPDRLADTIRAFNAACGAGLDSDFGRDPSRMAPIVTAPFYAIEIVPGVAATTGGAKRSARAEVIGLDGEPIPRLYEAGELGSSVSNLFQNGTLLTEAMIFGRIAGENAAREPPVAG